MNINYLVSMFYVRWWTNANAIVNHACRLCKSGLKLHKMKFDMIRKCCWGGGRQAKRGGERKNTYLFNKPYWCEILGVKFCMILKSNQAQWKVVNEKFNFFFKSPNMSHFERNIINIVVGNLMIVTTLNRWSHVNDC